MTDHISAMKQALEAMESFSTGIFKGEFTSEIAALRQAIQDIESYRQAYPDNYAPAHTDHPMRHWDRTCPACVYESDISPERADETVKDRHEFEEMVKKGTKAWADTPDDWVDDLRGGAEPVAYASNGCVNWIGDADYKLKADLYTAPPKREWVGLTDEEKEAATGWSVEHIEAKLKEKNSL